MGLMREPPNLPALLHEVLNVFTDQIGFDIDFITYPASAQIRVT
jgi:hypothetical protein